MKHMYAGFYTHWPVMFGSRDNDTSSSESYKTKGLATLLLLQGAQMEIFHFFLEIVVSTFLRCVFHFSKFILYFYLAY